MLLELFVLYAVALSAGLAWRGLRGPRAPLPAAAGRGRAGVQRLLVVGATGGTGRQVVLQALERGWTVTALARNPAKLDLAHPGLRVLKGDVMDPPSLEEAVRGQDAVISALGHRRYFGPSRILSDGTGNVLRAMEAAGVRRFVGTSSLGLGDSAGRLGLLYTFFTIPVVLPFYFWDRARQERRIAASGLDWVIVRPGALNDGEKRGAVRHGPGVGSLLTTVRVSRADVAAFLLAQATDDAYLGRAPGVCW
jgi:uncharacterized protein YbjT (DUF2867 family)